MLLANAFKTDNDDDNYIDKEKVYLDNENDDEEEVDVRRGLDPRRQHQKCREIKKCW